MKTINIILILGIIAIFIGAVSGHQSGLKPEEASKEAYLEKIAEKKGITVEEYKAYLAEQKKIKIAQFKEEAESKGMTIEEYKTYLYEKFEEEAKAKGMTVEEYKKHLVEEKNWKKCSQK